MQSSLALLAGVVAALVTVAAAAAQQPAPRPAENPSGVVQSPGAQAPDAEPPDAQAPDAQSPAAQPPDIDAEPAATFHSSSALVVLPVTVTDKAGELVPDLTRDRFIIYDDNHPANIRFFSSEDTPVSVALVIDNSASMRTRHGEVVAAASIFARLSNPDDELMALMFSDGVTDALGGRTLTAADEHQLAAAIEAARPDGRTALYDAVMAGLERLDSVETTRKVLILISDGGDNASSASLQSVLDRARRSSVTIYTIGLIDPFMQEIRGEKEIDAGVLQKLADLSGGRRFLPASAGPLITACQEIAHEIRESYTIGIEPQGDDGAFHRIRVSVASADGRRLNVRTRPGYFAPGHRGSK
jgi:VWFA-related protein